MEVADGAGRAQQGNRRAEPRNSQPPRQRPDHQEHAADDAGAGSDHADGNRLEHRDEHDYEYGCRRDQSSQRQVVRRQRCPEVRARRRKRDRRRLAGAERTLRTQFAQSADRQRRHGVRFVRARQRRPGGTLLTTISNTGNRSWRAPGKRAWSAAASPRNTTRKSWRRN